MSGTSEDSGGGMEGARGGAVRLLKLIVCCAVLAVTTGWAEEIAPGIAGKDDWLFYRYEFSEASDRHATEQSLALVAKFNRVLARNGVTMAFTMVPVKARIYARHLPDHIQLTPYLSGNYQRMSSALRAQQVTVLDLDAAFLAGAGSKQAPLYFRLDTHWSPSGAMLAAETIRAALRQYSVLQHAWAATPVSPYDMIWGDEKVETPSRDLVEQLPAGAPAYASEFTRVFYVTRRNPSSVVLLGAADDAQITLLGSSYSMPWTGFADALRYTLQRDVLDVAVGADRGSWVGMESYLRDDAFQTQRPKLLIWEMPERDMRAPPDYRYRDARYHSDNTEWLLRAAAWVEKDCRPAVTNAGLIAGGLLKKAASSVKVGATGVQDYVELSLDSPLQQLDYLSMQIANAGAKTLRIEAGEGAHSRKFEFAVAGDGDEHVFKTPLPSAHGGYSKVRIYPGSNRSFSLRDLKVCRQQEDLLR